MKVLVTGASRGIGRAVACALHGQGAALALCGRDADALSTLAAQLPGACVLAGDLRDERYLDGLVDRAAEALSGLDALVNCAGIVRYSAAMELSRAELADQLHVNFVAPLVLTQHAAAQMRRAARGGAVVNVASTLGLKPALHTAAYAASKAALISMTRAFALELGPLGIRVNAVAPGVIDTEMVRVCRPGADADAQAQALRQLHLLGRLGTPEEVAHAVLYLLEARFVTGSVLVVDGGLLVAS